MFYKSDKDSRPCDVCRKRKVRCYIEDGAQQCALCRAEAVDCTFLEPPSKRKRNNPENSDGQPTNKQSRARANTAGSFGEQVILPRRASPSRSFSGLHNLTPDTLAVDLQPENIQPDLQFDQSPASEGHLSPSTLEAGQTLVHYNGVSVEHVGLSGDNMPELNQNDAMAGFPRFKVVRQDDTHRPRPSNHMHPFTLQSEVPLAQLFEMVSPWGVALINLYIKIVHPIVPIIDAARVQATCARVTGIGERIGEGPDDSAISPMFASLFVIASNWWSFDPALGMQPPPDVSLLREFVRHTTLYDIRLPRIITIQALMMQYTMLAFKSVAKNAELWSAMGSLYTTAQSLGVNEDAGSWKLQKWEKALRSRLWWQIFISEKFLAHSLGRCSHIHADAYSVEPLDTDDFEDGVIPPHLANMTLLALILSDVLTTLYSPRTIRKLTNDIQATLELASPLFDRVGTWHTLLPLELAMSATQSADGLNSNGSVHLSYFVVKISIHRAIMRCRGISSRSYRHSAIETMQQVAQWAKQLNSSHIEAVWPTHSKFDFAIVASFIIALLFTSETEDDFQAVLNVLQSYRWTLSLHSRSSADLTSAALQRIDVFCSSGLDSLRTLWKRRRDLAVFQYRSAVPTRTNSPVEGESSNLALVPDQFHSTNVFPFFPLANQNTMLLPGLPNVGSSSTQYSALPTEIGFDFYGNSPLTNTSTLFWGNPMADGNMPLDLWHLNYDDDISVGLLHDYNRSPTLQQ